MDLGVAQSDEERESTYRFLNDEFSKLNDILLGQASGLDAKATLVAGFAAAAISFLLGRQQTLVSAAAVILDAGALSVAVAALWPRRWATLEPEELQHVLAEAAPVFVVGQVAGTKVRTYAINSETAKAKLVLWVTSVVLLGMGTALSIWSEIAKGVR